MTKVARIIDTNPAAKAKLDATIHTLVKKYILFVDLDIKTGDIRPGVDPRKARVAECQEAVDFQLNYFEQPEPPHFTEAKAKYDAWLNPAPKATGKPKDFSKLPAPQPTDRMLPKEVWESIVAETWGNLS